MYDQLVSTLLKTGAHRATKYLSDQLVVKATRRAYGKRFDTRRVEVHLSEARPNYAERKFIRACKKAGERFPVRKIQLKFLSR